MSKNERPLGVTLGWSMKPQICWESTEVVPFLIWFKRTKIKTYIYPYDFELETRPEYYPDGPGTWPRDPVSDQKLPTLK